MAITNSYKIICEYMPPDISKAMSLVTDKNSSGIDEVRIRLNLPVSFIMSGKPCFLLRSGQVSRTVDMADLVTANMNDIENIFMRLCKYSVHSSETELRQGFFTIKNGIRVGVAGEYNSTGEMLKKVTSFNFRVSREIIGCGNEIYNRVLNSGYSVLICGRTNSGKTTVLRDLCRLCGNREKVTLIDERREIAAYSSESFCFDIGTMTDIIANLKRDAAINSAIRTLSPGYIFCDEISNDEDCTAILNGHGCGVRFVSTVHAGSYSELLSRRPIARLLDEKVFDYAVFLYDENMPGRVSGIRRLKP